MTKPHHHSHPLTRPATSQGFDWLLTLLKHLLQAKPSKHGLIKGNFSCQEASYVNPIINEYRKKSGNILLDQHEHHPEFTLEEQHFAIKTIAKEVQKNAIPMPVISQEPHKIIYGDAHNPDAQITYTFSQGAWVITPGKNAEAVIIDPAGKIIEIKPGLHVEQHGNGGHLKVAHAHDHQHAPTHHHSEHDHHKAHKHSHHHDGPCSHACGHGATSHEHHHHHGHQCGHHHH